MNKAPLRAGILDQLRRELAQQVDAALLARDEAISEESRAENKYDTHSQEAAYLAEGQARIAAEIEANIAQYAALPLPDFGPDDVVALGAVVEVGDRESISYFLGPRAGGLTVSLDGREYLVITPHSPIGRQLLGKRRGDPIEMPGRGGAMKLRIRSVQ